MFAQNEQVERVEIKAAPGKANQYSLVAVSGKEFEVPLVRLVDTIYAAGFKPLVSEMRAKWRSRLLIALPSLTRR